MLARCATPADCLKNILVPSGRRTALSAARLRKQRRHHLRKAARHPAGHLILQRLCLPPRLPVHLLEQVGVGANFLVLCLPYQKQLLLQGVACTVRLPRLSQEVGTVCNWSTSHQRAH